MEEKRKGREKKGGVGIVGLGGGGGLVVLARGALVAAAVWGVYEFRKRRKESVGSGILRDFEIPSLEKRMNVEEGGDGLRLVLQSENLDVDVHASEIEEKGSSVGIDFSAKKCDLDMDEGLGLQINVEETIQEGEKNQERCNNDDGSGGESIPGIQEDDDAVYEESVDEVKQEAVDISDASLDADAVSSVPEDELGPQVEDVSPVLEDNDAEASENNVAKFVENKEVVVHSMTSISEVEDENSDDVESEESDSDVSEESASDVSEESSRETVDSSGESSVKAVWPAESMEELSRVLKSEKNLNRVLEEILEADDSKRLNSPNTVVVNDVHGYGSSNKDVRICKETLGSTAKLDFQQVENSTKLRIWLCSIFLAFLVLVVAFLTQPEYVSPDLARSVLPFFNKMEAR